VWHLRLLFAICVNVKIEEHCIGVTLCSIENEILTSYVFINFFVVQIKLQLTLNSLALQTACSYIVLVVMYFAKYNKFVTSRKYTMPQPTTNRASSPHKDRKPTTNPQQVAVV